MKQALSALRGDGTSPPRISFQQLKDEVGFGDYDREESRYAGEDGS